MRRADAALASLLLRFECFRRFAKHRKVTMPAMAMRTAAPAAAPAMTATLTLLLAVALGSAGLGVAEAMGRFPSCACRAAALAVVYEARQPLPAVRQIGDTASTGSPSVFNHAPSSAERTFGSASDMSRLEDSALSMERVRACSRVRLAGAGLDPGSSGASALAAPACRPRRLAGELAAASIATATVMLELTASVLEFAAGEGMLAVPPTHSQPLTRLPGWPRETNVTAPVPAVTRSAVTNDIATGKAAVAARQAKPPRNCAMAASVRSALLEALEPDTVKVSSSANVGAGLVLGETPGDNVVAGVELAGAEYTPLRVLVAAEDGEAAALVEADAPAECDAEAVVDAEAPRVRLAVDAALTEAAELPDAEDDAVADGEAPRDRERVAVPDADDASEALTVADDVSEGVSPRESETVAELLTVGGSEADGDVVAVEDGLLPGASDCVAVVLELAAAEALTDCRGVELGDRPAGSERVAVCVEDAAADPDSEAELVVLADAPGSSELVGVKVAVAAEEADTVETADRLGERPLASEFVGVKLAVAA